jgi:ABC-2 type transport system permease protein
VSASRIFAIARRIAQGFRRDERTLALMFVVPLVVTALLGWVLRDTQETTFGVWIANEAGAPAQPFMDAFNAATIGEPDGVAYVGWSDGPEAREAVRRAIREDNGDMGLVIPATLLDDIQAGRRPILTIITRGTEPGAEAEQLGRLQGILASVARQLAPPGAPAAVIPQLEHETVYLSPEADQVDVFAPVLLGFFGYFFVFLLTGVSFLRERIGGTLERLVATPVTRAEIVLGYSLGFGSFATLQIAFLTIFILNSFQTPELGPIPSLTIGLGVNSAGSPFLAFAIALLLSLGAVNLGIFLSTFARTELQVIQFIPLVIVPQGLLSGLLWPVERLPDILQAIAHALPLTYAVEGLREVVLKGADLSSRTVQIDLIVLAAIALVFVALASATIRREVA